MKTLRELYEEISVQDDNWSYYPHPRTSINRAWENDKKAYQFIQDYFCLAGKSKVFQDRHLSHNKKHIMVRSPHIVSSFLIGTKLAESIGVDLTARDEHNMSFQYYWFLACLYHDVGYTFEVQRHCDWLRMVSAEGIEACQEIFNIKYTHDRIFKTYPKWAVEMYLRERAACTNGEAGCIDHGIIGGLILYDKLRKMFERSWRKRINKADSRLSFYVHDDLSGRDLHLSSNHFDAYAKAADAIIAHNIWTDTLKKYLEKNHIDTSITVTHAPHPPQSLLLIILGIADTVEPVKRGAKYLDLVKIDSYQDSVCRGIELQVDNVTFKEIYGHIQSLQPWLNINVNVEASFDQTHIRITIPDHSLDMMI